MINSYSRGHKIYFDGTDWRYCDNEQLLDINKPCARCGCGVQRPFVLINTKNDDVITIR